MGRKVDLTGQRFGKLVALSEVAERDKHKRVLWKCLCDCGKQIQVAGGALKSGNTKSCGCITTAIDLVGQRFGKLVALNSTNKRSGRSMIWTCKCDCGDYTEVSASNLSNGHTKSCGCIGGSKYLVGKRFGKLTVTKQLEKRCFGNIVWECLCDCGSVTEVSTNALKKGNTKSCGCGKVKDLTGQRFGMLVAIKDVGVKNGRVWECLCDCGNYKNVNTGSLGSGKTKSCGCLQYPSGTDHPNYNPNLTEEDRLRKRYYLGGGSHKSWSKQVMERDNYTCQICNKHGGNLNAHHLNGWDAFPEQRFDLDNGETLCEDCHKEFHSQYGYGDNTREQFNEYAASKTLVLN